MQDEPDPSAASGRRHSILLYAVTTFLSAFLLLQAQPLIGKYLLPWFGGGPTVWTTILLFFQVALLGGYAYARFVSTRLAPRRQGLVHLVLLILTIGALPIIPREAFRPDSEGADPTGTILVLLAVTVGAPYVALSSTAPLIQRWFTHDHPRTSPSQLYALSSAGALVGLLTYPVIFERFIGLRAQAWLWSGAYVVFVVLCGALAWRFLRSSKDEADQPLAAPHPDAAGEQGRPVTPVDLAMWLLLPACASALLLATTHQLTQDVAAVPLLWIVPLSLYLSTFVLSFGRFHAYQPSRDLPILALGLGAGACAITNVGVEVLWQVLLYPFALFVCSFALHGELVRLRPDHRRLTAFCLMVCSGGALGGIFIALVAPVIFDNYWEYHLTLALTPLLVLTARAIDVSRRLQSRTHASRRERRPVLIAGALAAIGGIAVLGVLLAQDVRHSGEGLLARDRNFYGSVRVYESEGEMPQGDRIMMEQGRALQGFQYTAAEKRGLPSGYYSPSSGVSVALGALPRPTNRHFSVGVIGLGAGMVVANAKPEEDWTFYEINPIVAELAERHFTYLGDARARGAHLDNVLLGDGRAVLERQLQYGGQLQFDVLILDAFSGSAPPVHLLTTEAFETYWRVMNPNGVLAVNVSSRQVDLSPVVRKLAQVSGKEAYWISGRAGDAEGAIDSIWVLVTSNREFLGMPEVAAAALEEWPPDAKKSRLWTDDFSNVYGLLRFY